MLKVAREVFRPSGLTLAVGLTALVGALGAGPAGAATLVVASDTPQSQLADCANGACEVKTATAFYDPTVITTSSPAFGFYQNAFNNWNAGNPATGKWNLVAGGDLGAGTALNLYLTAHAADTVNRNDPGNLVGGAQIILSANKLQTPNAYSTPTFLDSYRWSQAIYSSYATAQSPPNYFGLDVTGACNGSTVSCGPLYPYQYTTSGTSVPGITNGLFYDNPEGPYPSTLFEAQSWITSADYASRTLTVFDGVAWGFGLSATLPNGATVGWAADPADVAEPATLALFGAGLLGLAWLRVAGGVGRIRRVI